MSSSDSPIEARAEPTIVRADLKLTRSRPAFRRIDIVGITPSPAQPWMMQIGRNLTDPLDGSPAEKRFLVPTPGAGSRRACTATPTCPSPRRELGRRVPGNRRHRGRPLRNDSVLLDHHDTPFEVMMLCEADAYEKIRSGFEHIERTFEVKSEPSTPSSLLFLLATSKFPMLRTTL